MIRFRPFFTHHLLRLPILWGAVFLATGAGPARANDIKTKPRFTFALGPWISKFNQSDTTHEARVTSALSGGAQVAAGLTLGSLFFADLTAAWFLPAYSAGPQARDANYFSPVGIAGGVSLPLLPIELFVGAEISYYGFSGGTDAGFHGYAPKAGTKVSFVNNGEAHNGVILEYRRASFRKDDAGDIPAHISTVSHVYFLGIFIAVN